MEINVNHSFNNVRNINNRVPHNENHNPKQPQRNLPHNTHLANRQTLNSIQSSLLKMNQIQNNMLLKELIDLPKDWQSLLITFANTNNKDQIKLLAQLLKNNPNISLDQIKQLLITNSNEAVNKLLKLTPQMTQSQKGAEQVQEILASFAVLIPKEQTHDKTMLQNLLCMYLPYLPITEQNRNDMQTGESEDEEKSNALITMCINSKQLGQFKIIFFEEPKELIIHIKNKACENEELKINIKDLIYNRLKEKNISAELIYQKEKSENHESTERNVSIQNLETASTKILYIVYLVLKVISDADEKTQLNKSRLEKLD